MIDLYYWTTPNGHKITMFLEETSLPYKIVQVNLPQNDQFKPDFLAISPNNKMPAIVDHDPIGGGAPLSIFESGAILQYLAEKTGKLMPQDVGGRMDVTQWLFWQVANLGPMPGQLIFFLRNNEKHQFGIDRYKAETERLYGVLNKRLTGRAWLAADAYTIADIAAYSWAAPYSLFGIDLDQYPAVEAWLEKIASRPATERAYGIARDMNPNAPQPFAGPHARPRKTPLEPPHPLQKRNDYMLDLYTDATPNGLKVSIGLEEFGLDYNVHSIFLGGDQMTPEFTGMNPNNKIPVLVDDGLVVTESGMILLYLAEKTGRLLPKDPKARIKALEMVFFQMASLGPMFGQLMVFRGPWQNKHPDVSERYFKEVSRIYKVLNTRLEGKEYLAGEFSIADIAMFPWVQAGATFPFTADLPLEANPNLNAWRLRLLGRPAVHKGLTIPAPYAPEKQYEGFIKATIGLGDLHA